MMSGGNRYNRRILKFFKWFSKWVPIAIMLFHAYGIWDFSRHPRDVYALPGEHGVLYFYLFYAICIADGDNISEQIFLAMLAL